MDINLVITDKKGAWYKAKVPAAHSSIFPQTLDALGAMCGIYGAAAIAEVLWGGAIVHLMNGKATTNPAAVALVAVQYCRSDDRARLSYPDWQGRTVTSAFPDLSPQSQYEAKLVGEETIADWRTDGSPGLHRNIRCTYQYIQSCTASEAAANSIKELAE